MCIRDSYGTYDVHLKPHYWRDTPKMICADEWSVQHETSKAIEYLRDVRDKELSLIHIYFSFAFGDKFVES